MENESRSYGLLRARERAPQLATLQSAQLLFIIHTICIRSRREIKKEEKQKTAAAATAREAVESMNEYVSCCNSIQGTLPIFKLNWM